jgi:tRNA threonylcarbamoyladenosine biosynthesis protein TsaB
VLVLAIETSTLTGSVALLEDRRLVGCVTLDPKQRTAQSLAPAMAAQLRSAGWQPRHVNLVAVSHGPGSFTGLRIGVTAAKAFAYAVGAEVLGVNTLEVIAFQAQLDSQLLWPVIDAQRGQLFAALFRHNNGGTWELLEPTCIMDSDEWIGRLTTGVGVSGPGLSRLVERLPQDVLIEDQQRWTPHAATVGQLAVRRHQSGERTDLWSLVPHYYRPSAADEKWAARRT